MARIIPAGGRSRLRSDPVRNFKFQVQLFHPDEETFNRPFADIGFTSVEGISMTTEMIPYREGGWNTNPHKIPGQTDFPPLTMTSGVFFDKPGMWNLAKQMFAVNWGQGTLGFSDGHGEEFRFDMAVRILDHPVTEGLASGVQGSVEGAIMAFAFYNCWAGTISFSGLNAIDNGIMIHQMTVHHEGFETYFGNAEAKSFPGQAAGGGAGVNVRAF